MMNEEAVSIGATNCNFTNPHGLTEENHYVTAYDLYLIFNEACKYELFKEIIGMSSYATVYYDATAGRSVFDKPSTNWYFNGEAAAPAGDHRARRKDRTLRVRQETVLSCSQAIRQGSPIFPLS